MIENNNNPIMLDSDATKEQLEHAIRHNLELAIKKLAKWQDVPTVEADNADI